MSARLLIGPDVPYAEWLARRAELSATAVTASEIAVLLGLSPYDSPFNLYHRKLGLIDAEPDNDVMSLGRHLEPWIADRWAEAHPEFEVGEAGLFVSTDRPWQMATPDRLLTDFGCECGPNGMCPGPHDSPTSLLEIKSAGSYDGWGEDGTDEIPVHYRAQVLWQLDTLGLKTAHVACLFLSSRSIRSYVVEWDAKDVGAMRAAAVDFLEQVKRRNPPPIDAHPATTAALKAIYPDVDPDAEAEVPDELAEEYEAACLMLTEAKGRKARHENEIRALAGDARRVAAENGTPVATRTVYERAGIDLAKLRADFPDAYEACRTTTTVDTLRPARARKDPK